MIARAFSSDYLPPTLPSSRALADTPCDAASLTVATKAAEGAFEGDARVLACMITLAIRV